MHALKHPLSKTLLTLNLCLGFGVQAYAQESAPVAPATSEAAAQTQSQTQATPETQTDKPQPAQPNSAVTPAKDSPATQEESKADTHKAAPTEQPKETAKDATKEIPKEVQQQTTPAAQEPAANAPVDNAADSDAADKPSSAEQSAANTEAFQSGYDQGCSASKRLVKSPTKATVLFTDRERFRSDDLYAEGWMEGFRVCQRNAAQLKMLNEKHESLKDLVPGAPEGKRTPPKLPSQLNN